MDSILVKIFATAFALGEVLTHPQVVRTHLDPATDQDKVVQVLRAGCDHMRRVFDIDSINLDDLISTALDDTTAFGANAKAFHGINFADLNIAYHQFCKNEAVDRPAVDLAQVIEFYNNAVADLPDPTVRKDRKLPSISAVLDGAGHNFTEVFEPGNRRIWVSLSEIPDYLQKATIAAEDHRFFEHRGVESAASSARSSAIWALPAVRKADRPLPEQVVRNLLVGEGGLDANGLANLLSSQKDQITAAMPSGLADMLGASGMLDALDGSLRRGADTASAAAGRMAMP